MLSLASRLYEKSGRKDLARIALEDFIKRFPDEATKREAQNRLKKIEMDIESYNDFPAP